MKHCFPIVIRRQMCLGKCCQCLSFYGSHCLFCLTILLMHIWNRPPVVHFLFMQIPLEFTTDVLPTIIHLQCDAPLIELVLPLCLNDIPGLKYLVTSGK